MRHCYAVFFFLLAMLVCVGIAIVVILLIASPSFREGERLLTPEGEEKVQNVRRKAAQVAQRAEQDATRGREAVRSAVSKARRQDEEEAEPQYRVTDMDSVEDLADENPADRSVAPEPEPVVDLAAAEQQTAPEDEGRPRRLGWLRRGTEATGATAYSATSGNTTAVITQPELAVSAQDEAPQRDAADEQLRLVEDDTDDVVPENFEDARDLTVADEPEPTEKAELTKETEPTEEAERPVDDETSDDGGFFTRITDSLNRNASDRARTGPRHARF